MATILISFIGIGTAADANTGSKSGYRTANYKFPAENGFAAQELESSIFGSVLLERLRSLRREVSRWVILGTEQSIWNDLIEILPTAKQNELLELWDEITSFVPVRGKYQPPTPMMQELLARWQTALSEKYGGTEIVCRLVGDCLTDESQNKVYQALLETVGENDEIVLDITHGLRHQPALASFMVMFLRWLRNVKTVEIYSGVLDMNQQVVKLDLCSDLLKASEAVATYRATGNFGLIGKSLELGAEFETNLEKLVFANEVNRADRLTPQKLKKTIGENAEKFSALQNSLNPILAESLQWSEQGNFTKRMSHRAKHAFEHKQFFQAIALLWESLLIAGCHKFNIANPTNHNSRVEAENMLYEELDFEDGRILRKVECLRNAVMHGTSPSGHLAGDVTKALNDENEFNLLFNHGFSLLQSLLD